MVCWVADLLLPFFLAYPRSDTGVEVAAYKLHQPYESLLATGRCHWTFFHSWPGVGFIWKLTVFILVSIHARRRLVALYIWDCLLFYVDISVQLNLLLGYIQFAYCLLAVLWFASTQEFKKPLFVTHFWKAKITRRSWSCCCKVYCYLLWVWWGGRFPVGLKCHFPAPLLTTTTTTWFFATSLLEGCLQLLLDLNILHRSCCSSCPVVLLSVPRVFI